MPHARDESCCRLSARIMALGLWSAAVLTPVALSQPVLTVTYRNSVALATTTTDQNGASFTIAGLSGLALLADGRWCAVMDNSNKLVFLAPTFSPAGDLASAPITAGLTLAQTRDFEDITTSLRFPTRVTLADESNRLSEFDLTTGQLTSELPVPAVFVTFAVTNFGFESLSRAGNTLWYANEEAMSIDGPLSTPAAGSSVRLQRMTDVGTTPAPSYAFGPQHRYLTAPMHGPAISGARSGLVALVALADGRLISMERSLALGTGLFQTRIYHVSTGGATNTSTLPSINVAGVVPVTKTLLWSGFLDNVEGLAIGRKLPGGAFTLLGITDDGDPISVNRLHAWTITGAPCGTADLASPASSTTPDSELTADDVIAFINAFITGNARADLSGPAAPVPDGELTADDIITFVSLFFAGC